MSKNLVIFGVLLVVSLFVKSCYDDGIERDTINAAMEEKKNNLIYKITSSANKHDAITDWGETISGGNLKLAPEIHTGTMQQVWLAGRPILFIGKVKDYFTDGNGFYNITLESNILTRHDLPFLHKNWPKVMLTSFEIHVICGDEIVSPVKNVLLNTKAFRGPQIAAIVQIENLKKVEADNEGHPKIVGYSSCLDLIEIDERSTWENKGN